MSKRLQSNPRPSQVVKKTLSSKKKKSHFCNKSVLLGPRRWQNQAPPGAVGCLRLLGHIPGKHPEEKENTTSPGPKFVWYFSKGRGKSKAQLSYLKVLSEKNWLPQSRFFGGSSEMQRMLQLSQRNGKGWWTKRTSCHYLTPLLFCEHLTKYSKFSKSPFQQYL